MLSRIVIINSAVHKKADILLEGVDSIQLVGPNNIGKSSFINTLNFLYIINQKRMQFEGNRTLKDSLLHYFPDISRSFILFEIYDTKRQCRYCILVKREKSNNLAYYHIPHAYEESWFFRATPQGQEVLSFEAFIGILRSRSIESRLLDSPEKRYQLVYGGQQGSAPVVQLMHHVAGRGSKVKPFTKVYKHLIRATRLSADDLVEAFMVAFRPASTRLDAFANRSSEHLERLIKKSQHIQTLKSIKSDFLRLKKLYQDQQDRKQRLDETCSTFFHRLPAVLDELNGEVQKADQHLHQLSELSEKCREEINLTREQVGGCKKDIEYQQQDEGKYKKQLDTIALHKAPLALSTLEGGIADLQQNLQTLKGLGADRATIPNLNKQIGLLTQEQDELQRKVSQFKDLLLHHLSPDPEISKLLHSLLSKELLQTHKRALKKPVTKVQDTLHLFDGEVDISAIKPTLPFTSLEELKTRLREKKDELEVVRKLQQDRGFYEKVSHELGQKQALWHQIQQEDSIKNKLKQVQAKLQQSTQQQKTLQDHLAKQENTSRSYQQKIRQSQEQKRDHEHKQTQYQAWAQDLKAIEHHDHAKGIDLLPVQSLEELYSQAQKQHKDFKDSQKPIQPLLDKLQEATQRCDSIEEFIKAIGDELDTLDELIQSRDSLLEGVLNQFSYPTQHLLASYNEFKEKIERFGRSLSAASISGIHQLAMHLEEREDLLADLKRIESIAPQGTLDLDNTKQENLNTLRRYIQQARILSLQDLFSLQIHIKHQPRGRTVCLDPRDQMESAGTDKTLRLFIFLQILKEMLDTKKQNRVVVYIDEASTLSAQNIQNLLAHCCNCHVLPIFASTGSVEGFQRYYQLNPSKANEGKVIVDNASDYIDMQRLTPIVQPQS